MFTWTNQPYEAMWNHLRMLKVPKNVEALLTGKMKSKRSNLYEENDLTLRKSYQIAYAIRQADEYFNAADTVSIVTSPLMYFYGMLSLAKAVIVADNEDLLLEDIKYHGLYTRAITTELESYNTDHLAWCMDKEFAVTNDGVLSQFIALIQGFNIPNQSIIRFKDILKINPEIGEIYNRYYDEPPHYFPLYHHTISRDPLKIELNPSTTDRELFLQSFDYISEDFDLSGEILHNQALIITSKEHLENFPEYMGMYFPVPGGKFLVSGLEYINDGESHRKYICPEICDYIGMFILGNIVRYKQEFWGQTVNGERDGSIALINLFVSIARNRFPNFILNKLFAEQFSYGSAGILM